MPDPTLPLPTEPVPYFDPTAMTPVSEIDAAAQRAAEAEASADQAEVRPVSVDPAAYAPPAVSAPPEAPYTPPQAPYVPQPAPYPPPQAPYTPPQAPYTPPQAPSAPPPGQQAGPPQLSAAPHTQQRPQAGPNPPSPIVAQIGDVRVSSTTIYTPIGEIPLRGSQWTVTDQWHARERIPAWAIVLAIVLFFCLTVFSLLFLLAKETVYSGMVQVVITNGTQQYVTRVPVSSQIQVSQLHQQVNYVRSLATL